MSPFFTAMEEKEKKSNYCQMANSMLLSSFFMIVSDFCYVSKKVPPSKACRRSLMYSDVS
jgi:hypothetical protein